MFFLEIDCADLDPIINLIKNGIIPLIQIGIPIILIILGMLDLGKAVMAGKEDEIKSAQKLLTKRCIAAVAVFFVVTIVTIVFNIVAGNAGKDQETATTWTQCWD